MSVAGLSRVRRKGLLPLLVIAMIYVVLAAPYVYSSAFQDTAKSLGSSEVSGSQLPSVARLYLDSGTQYYLSMVKPLSGNQTWAVVSARQFPPQSLVFIGSALASWNVQPYSLSIQGQQGFNMLIVAGSVTFVPQGASGSELWLVSSGKALLDLSTFFALAGPVLFIALAWYISRRLPLWQVVATAWVYVALLVSTDLVGSAYGLYPSFDLLAAAVLLIPGALVADRLEASIRKRLESPRPAPS